MLNPIDRFLNRITMYRLVLYLLLAWLAAAAVLGWFKLLPYGPFQIILSALFLLLACVLVNWIFTKAFEAPSNPESSYITALILALIIKPAATPQHYILMFWAAALAIGSKYILAIGKKHLFNPAAAAVALTALALNQSANWWVGTAAMFPLIFIGGILIVRKIQRSDLVFAFVFVTFLSTFGFGIAAGSNLGSILRQLLLDSPIWFFAFVMLTEPLTTPPTKGLQIFYGALTGLLFAPQTHFGDFYFTPELALLAGNVFAYFASPKQKLILSLKEKVQLTPSVYDFVFSADKKIKFKPGQYLEWTLGHKQADNRGSRRYFTIASAPTEPDLHLGVKFYQDSSTYKDALLAMAAGDKIVAGQLSGDFVLPDDPKIKLAFVAGGIGITPFRSMLKYLLDTGTSRTITLFYANRSSDEIAYRDILEQSEKQLGLKTVHLLGRFGAETIRKEMPDFQQRTFMISGPRSMVTDFEKILGTIGVPKKQIKTDFFPGFA